MLSHRGLRRGQKSPVPEESAKETVKTIRVRECRVIPVELAVTTLVCFFISHARLRVQQAPGIPHALCFGRRITRQKLARTCGEIAKLCLTNDALFEN